MCRRHQHWAMWKSALERCKKKARVRFLKGIQRGHDHVGIAKARAMRLEACLGAILESRERESFRLRE